MSGRNKIFHNRSIMPVVVTHAVMNGPKPEQPASPKRVRNLQPRTSPKRKAAGAPAGQTRSRIAGDKRTYSSKKRTRLGVRPVSKGQHRRLRKQSNGKLRQETYVETEAHDHRESAFTAGYELGKYEGGEQWLEQLVPANVLLPEVTLQEVIAAGVERLRPMLYPLIDVQDVYAEMEQAIVSDRPCAVVRLGDGELLALSQGGVYDVETVKREGRFLPYAGVDPPDFAARDQLALAVRHAQIVGVPQSRRKHFQPLLHPVLRSHDIDAGSLRMTNSTINYGLYQAGLLTQLLTGRKLLVIGNAASELARVLTGRGYTVSGVISPVKGFPDIERVMAELRDSDFDLALVSAGIPAVILCWRIAAERGKVALDFGHMADMIVNGNYTL
ncbi:GT-D fold domain-containing glycosyltransferase [Paenibacillus sp. sptzw28]|uniref:GT-D fold domain-containing protein n=1 Tax=Paenibacillus sp. sptzw28 TaxID=715179 RepID=UPI0021621ACF|nr:GT-D fold domain-containing glycosyltransferase [Paenibacillus sp. sptzw28]